MTLAETSQGISRKDDLKNKHTTLKQEYDASWKPHHKVLSEYLYPSLGRFDDQEEVPNFNKDRFSSVISGEAIHSLNILAAGLLSGLTSPARPWFRLTTQDKSLAKFRTAKIWLDQTRDRILSVMAASNFYTSVHSINLEIGAFGTGAMFIDSDTVSTIRCKTFTMGEYYINHDHSQRVDTLCRPFKMQAINVVNMFGKENVSERVKNKVFSPRLGTSSKSSSAFDWIDVVHFVQPNKNRMPEKSDNRNMPFQSVYYETTGLTSEEDKKFLSDSGFNTLPFMGIRWAVAGSDVYGIGPGTAAKGDTKMLQKIVSKYLAAINKTIDPPMNAPISMLSSKKSTVPGGVNYVDALKGAQSFGPTYQINFNFAAALEMINSVKGEIRRYLHSDLFQILANLERSNITAFEISKRLEEKRLTVGPLIERFHPEFADPAINRIFQIMSDAGMISDPPPELEGKEIQIEIISVLAQAQKLVGTVSIEQTTSFAGNLAGVKPEVLDVLNFDEMVREYSDLTGNPERMLVSEEEVALIRQERARQAQAQAQGDAMLQAAKGAELLSNTNMGENNALNALVGGQQGG